MLISLFVSNIDQLWSKMTHIYTKGQIVLITYKYTIIYIEPK